LKFICIYNNYLWYAHHTYTLLNVISEIYESTETNGIIHSVSYSYSVNNTI